MTRLEENTTDDTDKYHNQVSFIINSLYNNFLATPYQIILLVGHSYYSEEDNVYSAVPGGS